MKSDKNQFYFNNQIQSVSEIGEEFIDHSLHFSNGVNGEVRAYSRGGQPHLFRPRPCFEEILEKASAHNISCSLTAEDLMRVSYQLLNNNNLANASVVPVFYKKDDADHLFISVKKANPFTIRERLSLDHGNTDKNEVTVGQEGQIRHSTKNPFFFIKNEILYTPKVDNQEPGVLRDTIIECAIRLGHPVIEKSIIVDELNGSEAVFYSNFTSEMNFIEQFEGYVFDTDWRETIAFDLLMTFRQQVTNEDFWNYSII